MPDWLEVYRLLLEAEIAPFAATGLAYGLCTVFEIWAPAEGGQGQGGRVRNLVHWLFYEVAGLAALAACFIYRPAMTLPEYSLNAVESVLSVLAYVLAVDFIYYWYHRAQHRFRFLWAVHELHHADEELNATTSHRTWWLEMPVQAIVVGTPLLFVFGLYGPEVGLAILVVGRFFLIFAHCNFRLRLGFLTPLLCGPQVHRIHHSRLPEHQNRNFAQMFPFLDLFFGTWYAPSRDEFPPTGAPDLASDAPIWKAQLRPLAIWAEALRDWLALRAGDRSGPGKY